MSHNQKSKFSELIHQTLILGKLKRLVIGHDNTGDNPGWLLDIVTVTNGTTREKTIFECHDWLDKNKGDGRTVRELKPN